MTETDLATGAAAGAEPLTVTTAPYGADGTIVTVAGEADVMTAPLLRSALFDLGERAGSQIVLDLREVGFMDSTAISTMVAARRYLSGRGAELTLVYADGPVARVLSITKLDTVFRTGTELPAPH